MLLPHLPRELKRVISISLKCYARSRAQLQFGNVTPHAKVRLLIQRPVIAAGQVVAFGDDEQLVRDNHWLH